MDDLLFLLLGGQHGKHIRETYDGVQWRTDLMCHIRHEDRLQTSGVVGTFRLLLQTFLFADEVVDVSYNTIAAFQMAVLVEVWRTVDDVPQQVFTLVEEGAHVGDGSARFIEIFLWLHQSLTERAVDEVLYKRIEIHLALWGAKGFENVALPLGKRSTEEAHITGFHQILDFVLILLYGFVGLSDVKAVLLILKVEFALLGDIADGDGDAEDLPAVLVDRVNAYLRVAVHTTLDDDTLRAEVELFYMTAAQDATEGWHVEQGVLEVIGFLASFGW